MDASFGQGVWDHPRLFHQLAGKEGLLPCHSHVTFYFFGGSISSGPGRDHSGTFDNGCALMPLGEEHAHMSYRKRESFISPSH